MSTEVKNRGWSVTFSGTGINLAIGVLYAWSIVKSSIEKEINAGHWTWAKENLNDPYAYGLLVFAIAMIPGGRMLDKFGPRVTASLGGLLVGLGFIVTSLSSSLPVWILGFGVLACTGIGFAYASATPAAVKWFPASKTGLIAGLVVAGFGLASAYIAPLANFMLTTLGISQTMLYLGIAFFAVIVILSQFLHNPPAGYVPAETAKAMAAAVADKQEDYGWKEMIATPSFWVMWTIYAIGSGAGLMFIGIGKSMAKDSLGDLAWIAVTVLAIGNATGRVFAGILSDKIGIKASLVCFLSFQAAMIFSLMFIDPNSVVATLLVATFIGFNYGSNLTLFPAVSKKFFGLKNFGMNYGILFTAWGVGGLMLAKISRVLTAKNNGDLTYSYIMAASVIVIGIILTIISKAPAEKKSKEASIAQPDAT
jgi:MFS family permease